LVGDQEDLLELAMIACDTRTSRGSKSSSERRRRCADAMMPKSTLTG